MCVRYMQLGSGLLKSFSADADLLFLSERCYVSEYDSHAIFFNDIIKFFNMYSLSGYNEKLKYRYQT